MTNVIIFSKVLSNGFEVPISGTGTIPFDIQLLKDLGLREEELFYNCLLYTSPSPRDGLLSRMPSSA